MNLLAAYQQRFDSYYPTQLPQNTKHLGYVYDAINYSFAAGGKRLRPALVYALADSLAIPMDKVDAIALAIECIHTYSLIHDDLPAMDDDDLRRGKPACHKQFNEAAAILAGDALNTLAFEILSQPESNTQPDHRLRQIQLLAQHAGIHGMVGGQDMDLYGEDYPGKITIERLSQLHSKKTGKLIEACLTMSYLAANNPDDGKLSQLSLLGQKVGLLYQIQDDILDVTKSSEMLGKPSQSDINNNKCTYVSLLGLAGAKQQSQQLEAEINQCLKDFFDSTTDYQQTPLYQIIEKIIQRQN